VFGGSFDPVHNGHLFIAGEILRRGAADEVLFVPAAVPPHKTDRELAGPEDRYAMLEAAIAPFQGLSLSDIEIRRTDGPSYTIETLTALQAVFPESELRFVMGTDSLAELHTWREALELASRYEFIIFPRPGAPAPAYAVLAGYFGWKTARKLLDSILPAREMPVSSTEVRECCRRGKSLAGLAPECVAKYIRSKGLYGGRDGR